MAQRSAWTVKHFFTIFQVLCTFSLKHINTKIQNTALNFFNVNSEKALCESIIYMLSINKTVLKLLILTYFATECFWRL